MKAPKTARSTIQGLGFWGAECSHNRGYKVQRIISQDEATAVRSLPLCCRRRLRRKSRLETAEDRWSQLRRHICGHSGREGWLVPASADHRAAPTTSRTGTSRMSRDVRTTTRGSGWGLCKRNESQTEPSIVAF